MVKRKKSSKKSSKCPEPFNSLIDIAVGITMHVIADKMEKKHNYHKRGAPNPYRASAYGFVAGKMRTTEDILKLGTVMGAMGSFDDDYMSPEQHPNHADTTWGCDSIGSHSSQTNDNKYAWRMNCEDGTPYGVSPFDYDTRDAYNIALLLAKEQGQSGNSTSTQFQDVNEEDHMDDTDTPEYIFCRVSRMDNGRNEYYLSEHEDIKIGDIISIPPYDSVVSGVVLSVEHHTRKTAPQSPDETEHIRRL